MPLPSIDAIGRLFGLELPKPGAKARCPIRTDHKRHDKTFRVYRSKNSGDELFKCWSCDPPDNVGDSVALYALLAACNRREAFVQLIRAGLIEARRPENAPAAAPSRLPARISVAGSRPAQIQPLELALWERWARTRTGAVERFAAQRHVSADVLRQRGVIDMAQFGSDAIGFTYFNGPGGPPCRVKVRKPDRTAGVVGKKMWCEPRASAEDPGKKALAPLYGNECLQPLRTSVQCVILTEGELDALTLTAAGLPNVVSLPDGAESAGTVDLSPIYPMFTEWLVSVDSDEAGDRAWATIYRRAASYGVDAARLYWRKVVVRDDEPELVTYKDANQATMRGLQPADFLRCVSDTLAERFGCAVDWPPGVSSHA